VKFYYNFFAQYEQSTISMLDAILLKPVGREGIPEHVWEGFRKAREESGPRGLRLPDMVEIVKKAVTSLRRIFVWVDALDERAPKDRWEVPELLQEIVRALPNM